MLHIILINKRKLRNMLKTCNVTVYSISIFNIIQLIFNILSIYPNFIQLIQLLLVGIMFHSFVHQLLQFFEEERPH